MIPRPQFIYTALFLLPLTAVAPVVPGGWLLVGLLFLGLIGVAGVDALRAPKTLDAFQVESVPVVRMNRDREGVLELFIKGTWKGRPTLRLGLPLPRELETPRNPYSVQMPAGGEPAKVELRCTPRKRGHWHLNHGYLEVPSPLGFWDFRKTLPLDMDIRVYSDLSRERKALSGFFLRKGQVGTHTMRQLGKGREFEQLREYIPGDSYEDIHWKATAKRNEPVTKLFRLERTQDIVVVLDHSRMTGKNLEQDTRESPFPETMLERFIRASLVLFLAADQQGDRFGLFTYGKGISHIVKPGNGQKHLSTCQDILYQLDPEPTFPDFNDIFTRLRVHLRRRTLLLFLTDLSDPVLEETFQDRLSLINRQHLVLVHTLRGEHTRPLFGGDSPEAVSEIYQRLAGHLEWDRIRRLQRQLQVSGITMHSVAKENLVVNLVDSYLRVKSRQLL